MPIGTFFQYFLLAACFTVHGSCVDDPGGESRLEVFSPTFFVRITLRSRSKKGESVFRPLHQGLESSLFRLGHSKLVFHLFLFGRPRFQSLEFSFQFFDSFHHPVKLDSQHPNTHYLSPT